MTLDLRAYRTALGSFPTGVAVITTTASAEHHMGITVNSFTSVSLEPPLVLWCLDKKSDRYHAFTKARSYTVSILGTEHQDVSSRLAKQGNHSLDGIALSDTELGPPALADALSVFECEAEAVHDAGDHAILIGRVVRFSRLGNGEPLVFFRGKYGSLAQAS
ncbi:MAG TPA: flavin reductase family protein [Rhizomicrobium sp.]|nr:flavin reductase family protein [Rhizomicrobium sp.]